MAKTEILKRTLYNGKVHIDFYPNSHRYKKDGESLRSVSKISNIVDKSSILMKWALGLTRNKLMEKFMESDNTAMFSRIEIEEAIAQKDIKSEEAMSIGTMVHEFAEAFTKYKLKQITEEEMKAKIPTNENARNGVKAFVSWVKEHNVEFTDCEKLVYSVKNDYVGICDSIAYVDGKIHVIDYKTSKGIYSDHLMQVSAYKMALEEEFKEDFGLPIIVKFGKDDGEVSSFSLTEEVFESAKVGFLGACKLQKEVINLNKVLAKVYKDSVSK